MILARAIHASTGFLALLAAGPAAATCLSVADRAPILTHAAYTEAAVPKEHVGLTFVGHATFLIESPEGVRIATDYNDYLRPGIVPDVVTMNRTHSSHFTDRPDPRIEHVLRGWEPGSYAQHNLALKDVRIRNIPTNTRDWSGGTIMNGNSIFVFEIAGLCIAHLGHLHHTLTPARLAELGQIDVLMVPVDGSYTLNDADLLETLKQIRARVMIPMHFFSQDGLERFLGLLEGTYPVRVNASPSIVLSRADLPQRSEILVLPGH